MSEIGAIGKDKKNQTQGFMYRGVDDVMNALQPILTKYKVFIVPEVIKQVREEKTSKSGTALVYSICDIKYTFYADDGSSITAVVVGEGMDSGDKATNKAMSIAFKYVCFQVFCIPTEEMADPDKETHELKGKQTTQVKTAPQHTDKPADNPVTNGNATKAQVAEVFKLHKIKSPNDDVFEWLAKMESEKKISTKFPYTDKEKTKVNWTIADCEALKADLELPF